MPDETNMYPDIMIMFVRWTEQAHYFKFKSQIETPTSRCLKSQHFNTWQIKCDIWMLEKTLHLVKSDCHCHVMFRRLIGCKICFMFCIWVVSGVVYDCCGCGGLHPTSNSTSVTSVIGHLAVWQQQKKSCNLDWRFCCKLSIISTTFISNI